MISLAKVPITRWYVSKDKFTYRRTFPVSQRGSYNEWPLSFERPSAARADTDRIFQKITKRTSLRGLWKHTWLLSNALHVIWPARRAIVTRSCMIGGGRGLVCCANWFRDHHECPGKRRGWSLESYATHLPGLTGGGVQYWHATDWGLQAGVAQ